LISTPVQVIEGHFPPPIGKTDVLKAPKHFPVPVMKYTLHDMVLIWEIFGGQDFSSASNTRLLYIIINYVILSVHFILKLLMHI